MKTQHASNWQLPFFTVWSGQQLSWLGSSVAGFALVWWLTRTTGSATVLATAMLATLLPGVLLGPFVGALIDRWNRRIVMIVADSCTVNVVAPPLSAFLLGLLPLHVIMAIDVLTAAFAIAPLFFVHVPQPRRATAAAGAAAHKPVLWVDVRDGLRYVWNWTGLLVICVASMLLNFLINPAMSLVPILVIRHFGGQAMQLGWMNSTWGVGLLAGGLLLSAWGGFRRRIVTALMGTVGRGVASWKRIVFSCCFAPFCMRNS